MLSPVKDTEVGKLDVRITFQEKMISTNESNEDEEIGWQDVVTVWASKEDISGVSSGEEYRAEKLTAYQNTIFKIRYRTDITTKLRLVCNGVNYGILEIAEDGRKRFLTVTAETGEEYQESSS
jgi:SPP1 family predicted phage head-tail adaptor